MKLIAYIKKRIRHHLLPFRINTETYYPEAPRKSPIRQKLELIWSDLRYGLTELSYYSYGIDRKGVSLSQFVDKQTFIKLRDGRNKTEPFNYICILRDKDLFSIVGMHYGMPVIDSLGIFNEDTNSASVFELLATHKHLFIKPIDDMKGNGVLSISENEDALYLNGQNTTIDKLRQKIDTLKGRYLIQSRLFQHPDVSKIYPHSINTLRIVTINPHHSSDENDIVLIGCVLRMGAHGSNVDNWSKGGVVAKVNSDGFLDEYGFFKPGYGTKTKYHPDTKVVFKGTKIPFFNEAIRVTKQFHCHLNNIFSIGWDVAITVDGPVFIEGNDNWGCDSIQICHGSIKGYLDKYFI